MLNKIRKVNDFIAKILLSIGTLLFIILVLVVLLQIATRLFIPISISWTEEISRFLFLHIIAFVAPVVLKERKLVFVDLLFTIFPKKIINIFKVISDLMISILSIIIFSQSYKYILLGVGQIAPVTGLPMYIPYSMVFILFLFLSLYGITNFLNNLIKINKN